MFEWSGIAVAQDHDTRERILEAAGPVFAEWGFERATVRTICRRARVNIAAVNYHFRDKEGLYIETVRRAHLSRMAQFPIPDLPRDMPPAEKLRLFIRVLLTRMVLDECPAWHIQLMMRELLEPTAACMEMVRDFIRPNFDALLGILSEILPEDTSLDKRHLVAFSIVGQCLHYRVARPVMRLLIAPEEFATYDVDRLAAHITDFTLAALGLGEPLGRAREGR